MRKITTPEEQKAMKEHGREIIQYVADTLKDVAKKAKEASAIQRGEEPDDGMLDIIKKIVVPALRHVIEICIAYKESILAFLGKGKEDVYEALLATLRSILSSFIHERFASAEVLATRALEGLTAAYLSPKQEKSGEGAKKARKTLRKVLLERIYMYLR